MIPGIGVSLVLALLFPSPEGVPPVLVPILAVNTLVVWYVLLRLSMVVPDYVLRREFDWGFSWRMTGNWNWLRLLVALVVFSLVSMALGLIVMLIGSTISGILSTAGGNFEIVILPSLVASILVQWASMVCFVPVLGYAYFLMRSPDAEAIVAAADAIDSAR